MNVLFAWFLFLAVFMVGLPTPVEEGQASDSAKLTITHVLAEGPADAVSLPVGAEIISVATENDYLSELVPSRFSEFTSTHGSTPIVIGYVLGGEEQSVTITPEIGLIIEDPERPAVGIALSLVEVVKQPVHTAVVEATKTTVHSLGAIAVGIGSLAVNSVKGTADFSEVAGPIGIVGLVGDAAQFGITSLLMFTAIISLNLAVINLLPLPALDGGRLVFVAIETVTRREINPVWVARINFFGFALLMLLMIAVTYSDIVKII